MNSPELKRAQSLSSARLARVKRSLYSAPPDFPSSTLSASALEEKSKEELVRMVLDGQESIGVLKLQNFLACEIGKSMLVTQDILKAEKEAALRGQDKPSDAHKIGRSELFLKAISPAKDDANEAVSESADQSSKKYLGDVTARDMFDRLTSVTTDRNRLIEQCATLQQTSVKQAQELTKMNQKVRSLKDMNAQLAAKAALLERIPIENYKSIRTKLVDALASSGMRQAVENDVTLRAGIQKLIGAFAAPASSVPAPSLRVEVQKALISPASITNTLNTDRTPERSSVYMMLALYLQQENEELRKELASTKQQMAEMTQDLGNMRSNHTQQVENTVFLEEIIESNETQVEQLRASLTDMERELRELKAQLAEESANHKKAQHMLQHMQAHTEQERQALANAKRQIDEASEGAGWGNTSALAEDNKFFHLETANLQEEVERCKSRMRSLQVDNEALTQEVESLRKAQSAADAHGTDRIAHLEDMVGLLLDRQGVDPVDASQPRKRKGKGDKERDSKERDRDRDVITRRELRMLLRERDEQLHASIDALARVAAALDPRAVGQAGQAAAAQAAFALAGESAQTTPSGKGPESGSRDLSGYESTASVAVDFPSSDVAEKSVVQRLAEENQSLLYERIKRLKADKKKLEEKVSGLEEEQFDMRRNVRDLEERLEAETKLRVQSMITLEQMGHHIGSMFSKKGGKVPQLPVGAAAAYMPSPVMTQKRP